MNTERTNICDLCQKVCKSYKGMKIHRFHCLKKQTKSTQEQILSQVQIMPEQIKYIEVPKSKYTTIQVEFPASCYLSEINTFVCAQECECQEDINNPQQAAFFANLIQEINATSDVLKQISQLPIEINYGMHSTTFMISISFQQNTTLTKNVMKMLIDKIYAKNLKPAFQLLQKVDKKFADHFGQDAVLQSMSWFQKNVNLVVMSKVESTKFQDTLGKFYITKAQQAVDKLSIPQTNPIPLIAVKPINKDEYIQSNNDIHHMNVILWATLEAYLSGRNIDYIIKSGALYIKRGELVGFKASQFEKFMFKNLKFTDYSLIVKYKDLTDKQKEKMTQQEYLDSLKQKHQKKTFEYIQFLLSTASVPYDQINICKSQLGSYDLQRDKKVIYSLTDLMKHFNKKALKPKKPVQKKQKKETQDE